MLPYAKAVMIQEATKIAQNIIMFITLIWGDLMNLKNVEAPLPRRNVKYCDLLCVSL